MKPLNIEMAARLMEKLKVDSEAPDAGKADEGAAPCAPPASHAKMAAKPDAPAGIELDAHGNPIPLAQRTAHHQEEAASFVPRKIGEAD